mmetsp:Transcript_6109/g.15985  ORF Transcript_6109/g.15985 Transcript_6109/m.15985 type:complete len:272 (+) Transcript_6109:79-894(+)
MRPPREQCYVYAAGSRATTARARNCATPRENESCLFLSPRSTYLGGELPAVDLPLDAGRRGLLGLDLAPQLDRRQRGVERSLALQQVLLRLLSARALRKIRRLHRKLVGNPDAFRPRVDEHLADLPRSAEGRLVQRRPAIVVLGLEQRPLEAARPQQHRHHLLVARPHRSVEQRGLVLLVDLRDVGALCVERLEGLRIVLLDGDRHRARALLVGLVDRRLGLTDQQVKHHLVRVAHRHVDTCLAALVGRLQALPAAQHILNLVDFSLRDRF